jgi:rfaE bifunctional protein nucleotidyltransferase chain/domain/rfaE bifunctional protein kinase chain/domain
VIRVVVVGDSLFDRDWSGTVRRVSPDAPVPVVEAPRERCRPGGAGLAARLAAGKGAEVTLITALGTDDTAADLRRLFEEAGVGVVDVGLDGPTPEKLRVRSSDQSLVRIDRGCEPVVPPGPWPAAADEALAGADAVLVADYGRGMASRALPAVTALVERGDTRPATGRRPVVVWDPHPAGPVPPAGLDAVTPNLSEAAGALDRAVPATVPELADVADQLAAVWGSPIVLTTGERGAVVADPPGPPAVVPATPARGDSCGAGDCFAATLTTGLGRRRTLTDAVAAAVIAAGRFVRGEGEITAAPVDDDDPSGDGPDPVALAARVRAEGGTVVAAGGCFDLLHPGHLRTLEAARALGDCLVVCLNGDASVRRLKGAGRPVNPAVDRARLLLGLRCVDAVAVFDEDTPVEALGRLRPHVFAKGGDYAGVDMPEVAALAAWGGRVVVLPLVAGRSTTRLIERAGSRTA